MSQIKDSLFVGNQYRESDWFGYLDHGMKDLVATSLRLVKEESQHPKHRFHDYSFVVFPMAKAYEGYLKKLLLDVGLITHELLTSRFFRIGRSLNPQLPDRLKDDSWVYDDLYKISSQKLRAAWPHKMWSAWVESRNGLFHYFFPDHQNFITLGQSQDRLVLIVQVMEEGMGLLE